jgi:hypothetical protein
MDFVLPKDEITIINNGKEIFANNIEGYGHPGYLYRIAIAEYGLGNLFMPNNLFSVAITANLELGSRPPSLTTGHNTYLGFFKITITSPESNRKTAVLVVTGGR